MKSLTLILRGARFYWRTHLGVVLGAALATMVLTGSLLTGDAVKATLRRQAELRVGHADVAVTTGDRFPSESVSMGNVAPALMVPATIARADGGARVNASQLLGVSGHFWEMSPGGQMLILSGESVALNERLAHQLRVNVGDTVVVRVEKPGMFSRDAPMSGEENAVVAWRANVVRIIGDEQYGRFSLAANQVPPMTVFADLIALQFRLGIPGRVNLFLAPTHAHTSGGTSYFSVPWIGLNGKPTTLRLFRIGERKWETQTSAETLKGNLSRNWTLEGVGLELRTFPNNSGLELRTPRVFLDPPVVAAAPRGKDDRRVDSLTYFVNAIEANSEAGNQKPETRNSTPYSIVTAIETASSGFLPAELADNEIVISQWLADDLGIGTGAKVTLKYFVMGERRQLEEKAREFTVLAVLPMDEPQLNGSWMPDFPGLKDAKNCREWKPGFEIDMTKMREKDNEYWEKYRGTPKAFVNLKVGQEMWGNRWGNVTSMRWPAGTDRAEIEKALREKLTPEMLGFQFIPLRAQALAATDAPVDFGELFVYFSFFLIAAAAVLTGMLFTFSLEQRNAEAGLLLALGLRAKQVRRLFLAEGAVLAIVGSVIGIFGAVLYTKLVLRALATVWRGAVGTTEFVFIARPETLGLGTVSGVMIAVLAMWWASRRQLRQSARALLTGEVDETESCRSVRSEAESKTGFGGAALAGVCIVAAGGLLFFSRSAETFFGAGALLLIGGLVLAYRWLRSVAQEKTDGLESLAQLGSRNAARRRGRSVAIMAVLGSGVFMVVAVDAFRQRPAEENGRRDSGTGGFALVGESAMPIYDDLNTTKGREAFALDEKIMEGVSIVPMRVRDGDDASCLNLNRALQPRVLGVKADELRDGMFDRFHFTEAEAGWGVIESATSGVPGAPAIPAIVDDTTLKYALKMKIGDAIDYRDERGQSFPIRILATLSGSILQGSVLISESHFVEKFPGNGGYRFFLIDCPRAKIAAVREHLSRQLADRGLELTPAAQRLAEFQAVENTYLSIFQALGGLGLLLGSAGLAIVVARNVLERRREFGLLAAVGFRARQMRALVFAEHRWLIVCGLCIGTVSALVAVWPGLRERANGFPFAEMALLLAGLALGCVFWAWLATRIALRGSGLAALRSE